MTTWEFRMAWRRGGVVADEVAAWWLVSDEVVADDG
jgi:hypothetical protein